jgi:hypothetical protein
VWENGVTVPWSVNLALDTAVWADTYTLSDHFAASARTIKIAVGMGLNGE